MKNFLKYLIIFISVAFLTFFSLEKIFALEKDAKVPEFYIKAVNPGYTVDGKNNVGEMIEISRRSSDAMVSLASMAISYTNSSGKRTVLFEFPEHSFMSGESILLRLASSPESELAAINYTKTLAFKGELSLELNGEVLDSVCWTGKEGCLKEFKSASPTVLVRNLETGEFEHVSEYEPVYEAESYFVLESSEEKRPSQCRGLVFSEILSYFESSKSEQFIEIYNSGTEQILSKGCQIKYKNKVYEINGGIIKPEGYFVYYPTDFSLTKNPTSSGVLELVDTNGDILDRLEYPNGQRKGTSYAFIGYDAVGEEIWRTTYAPTPGEANNYQEYKTCEAGKVINKETGNCVKVTGVSEKICGEGQYLNILTGRCKKIETVTERVCKEGYELNPETNRCRKIKVNNGANYSLEPENYEEKSSFIALYAVVGVVILGLGYLVFEFRQEIRRIFGKVFRRSR